MVHLRVQASGGEGIVLVHKELGAFGEGGPVVVSPPIVQAAVTIVFGALVVETVANLVANNSPNTTIVSGVVCFRVEERRLQNSCRENDFVHHRVEVGVYRLRIHEPFGAVHRLA